VRKAQHVLAARSAEQKQPASIMAASAILHCLQGWHEFLCESEFAINFSQTAPCA
jgi:hypothetical protein